MNLDKMTPKEAFTKIMKDLKKFVEGRQIAINYQEVNLPVSYGVCFYSQGGWDLEVVSLTDKSLSSGLEYDLNTATMFYYKNSTLNHPCMVSNMFDISEEIAFLYPEWKNALENVERITVYAVPELEDIYKETI